MSVNGHNAKSSNDSVSMTSVRISSCSNYHYAYVSVNGDNNNSSNDSMFISSKSRSSSNDEDSESVSRKRRSISNKEINAFIVNDSIHPLTHHLEYFHLALQ